MANGQGRPVSSFIVGTRRRKIVILLVCWLVEGVFCAIFLRGDSRLVIPTVEMLPEPPAPTSPAAGTGAFFARSLDASAGYQPSFCLGWKNLRAENGRLGVLKTPLHRTVRIDGLQVKFYEHAPTGVQAVASPVSDAPRPQDSDVNSRKPTAKARFTEVLATLRDEFRPKSQGITIESPLLLNISNTSKVIINGLDYRLICGEQLQLAVQCRSAVASSPEIELRGGVIIQADGRKLISSYVLWDMEKEQFSVPGTYILDRNGVPVRGSGLRCDHHLQPLVATGAYSKKGVEKWTGGSSF